MANMDKGAYEYALKHQDDIPRENLEYYLGFPEHTTFDGAMIGLASDGSSQPSWGELHHGGGYSRRGRLIRFLD